MNLLENAGVKTALESVAACLELVASHEKVKADAEKAINLTRTVLATAEADLVVDRRHLETDVQALYATIYGLTGVVPVLEKK